MCSIRKSCTRNSHPYNWSSPINVLLPDPVYLCLLQPLESKHFLARLWPCWLTASVVRHYRFWPCPQAQLSLALRLWTGLASRQTAPAVAGSLFLPGDLVPRPSTSAPASPSASTLALCFSNRVYTMEYYSVIKKNTFESVLMRWMKLEPIIQSEVSQKEKRQYSILMHIYGIYITRCSSWFQKRQRNQRSNCQHLLDH